MSRWRQQLHVHHDAIHDLKLRLDHLDLLRFNLARQEHLPDETDHISLEMHANGDDDDHVAVDREEVERATIKERRWIQKKARTLTRKKHWHVAKVNALRKQLHWSQQQRKALVERQQSLERRISVLEEDLRWLRLQLRDVLKKFPSYPRNDNNTTARTSRRQATPNASKQET